MSICRTLLLNPSKIFCADLIRRHRATRDVPQVSEFYDAGAESPKFHIIIYENNAFIGTNRFIHVLVEMGSLEDGDLTRRGVYEMRTVGYRELRS